MLPARGYDSPGEGVGADRSAPCLSCKESRPSLQPGQPNVFGFVMFFFSVLVGHSPAVVPPARPVNGSRRSPTAMCPHAGPTIRLLVCHGLHVLGRVMCRTGCWRSAERGRGGGGVGICRSGVYLAVACLVLPTSALSASNTLKNCLPSSPEDKRCRTWPLPPKSTRGDLGVVEGSGDGRGRGGEGSPSPPFRHLPRAYYLVYYYSAGEERAISN